MEAHLTGSAGTIEQRSPERLLWAAGGVALILALVVALLTTQPLPSGGLSPEATKREALADLAAAPLRFVPNAGQADPSAVYLAQGPGYAFAFGRDGVRVSLVKRTRWGVRPLALGLSFVGTRGGVVPDARGPATGRVDYMVGERSRWRTGLVARPRLVYRDLWPGVDMVFKGSGGRLEYEFRLRPGANPDRIRLAYRGAESLSLAASGALMVHTRRGVIEDAAPVAFQQIGGRRVPVGSRFGLGRGNEYGIATGTYDRTRALVIDPALEYSTYLGGGLAQPRPGAIEDSGLDIEVRGHDAFVTGLAATPNFPVTDDAYQSTNGGMFDAFLTRIDTRREGAAALEYSSYLGGAQDDAGRGLDVRGHDAYIVGVTRSTDFPVTPDAFQTTNAGAADVFVARIDTSRHGAASLVYSTYLGGSADDPDPAVFEDEARAIALSGNDAFVTGLTRSTDFPVSSRAYSTHSAGGVDAFVTRLDLHRRGARALEYSTYLGGTAGDEGRGIAIDGRDAVIAGLTSSTDFPVTPSAVQGSNAGLTDAFVARLDTRARPGTALEFSSYLGGGAADVGRWLALEGHEAYVTGNTDSVDFPVTAGTFQASNGGATDAFVAKLDTRGAGARALGYSTYLGGAAVDAGVNIAVEHHQAFVAGITFSPNFPVTANAFQPTMHGAPGTSDAYIVRLDPRRQGTAGLAYSTFLGGSFPDFGLGIGAVGKDAIVTGQTYSPDFPVTPNGYQLTHAGSPGATDAFLSRLDTGKAR